MSFSQFTPKDYEIIAREYAGLKEAARKRCGNEQELEIVQKAFDFANEAHKNIRRRSGEPYILHPIAVAKIVVSDIGLGYKSIIAALLHDVVEDTDYKVQDIKYLFGTKVASLVDGLTKIKNVLDNQDKNNKDDEYTQSIQAENFKRILLTLNDDVRVVLIKLADRLHNCRTIEYMPEYKRDKILSETMFIFVPLAHRLGLYEVKSEMENIWLRYKEPDAYNDISARVNRDITDRANDIDEFIEPINKALSAAGFRFEVKKRVKTPYSIWNKIRTKNVTFEQIYDLYAVRIIFDAEESAKESERDQCYHIFSIITGIYTYKPDRLRDWVRQPKSNGYEALHCTLMSNKGIWIEVQIRTRRMDEIAEKGIAAHWSYKRGGYSQNESEMDKWLGKVKEIIVNPDVNALELLDIIHNDLISSDIDIFTPKGEQKSIQKGATALDFAYMIHSQIGNKAIAAKVNRKLVPLSYVLKSGDLVEIISAENATPKKEWMLFLQTRHAKGIVLNYFRDSKDTIATEGKIALATDMMERGIQLNDYLAKIVSSAIGINNFEEICFRYGMGIIKFDDIATVVDLDAYKALNEDNPTPAESSWRKVFPWLRKTKETEEAPAEPEEKPKGKKKKIDRTAFVINSPSDPHRYVLSSCCHPIAGDPVVGFLLPDGKVIVHKKTCPTAESMGAKHGDWLVAPRWADDSDQSFPVRISLKGLDRMGLLNDITSYISHEMSVNMRKLNLSTDQGIFEGYIDLYVRDKDVLMKMIEQLHRINGLQEVQRIEL